MEYERKNNTRFTPTRALNRKEVSKNDSGILSPEHLLGKDLPYFPRNAARSVELTGKL